MNARAIVAAHDGSWVEGRLNQQSRIGESGVTQSAQAAQRWLEHALKVIVEHRLGVRQRPDRVEVVAALLQVTLVEAAQTSREVFRPVTGRRVGQVALGMQKVHAQERAQDVFATSPLVRSQQQRGIVGRLLKRRAELRAIEDVVAQLIFTPQIVGQIIA